MTSTIKALKNFNLDDIDNFDIAIFPRHRDARGELLFSKFGSLSTTVIEIDSGSVDNFTIAFDKPKAIVFLDISCISSTEMAAVFSELFTTASTTELDIYVGYVIAAYTPPPEHLPRNEDIRPLAEHFAGWPRYPSARTSLIVGVGYEREKAEGACEYFDSNEIQVFVPTSPIIEYESAVAGNNAQLLATAERTQRLHKYSLDNPEQTFGQIATLLANMVNRTNPVLLPFGPKLFLALCLIAAEMFKDAGVWHVAGEVAGEPRKYEPSDHIIAFKLELAPVMIDELNAEFSDEIPTI